MPSGGGYPVGSAAYRYDAVGNPDPTQAGVVLETGNRLTGFNGYTLGYDADGNLTSKSKSGVIEQTLTWNALGQLVQVVTNGTTVTYGYDGLGRRIRRTGVSTMQYVYDGDNLLFERDGSGNLTEYTYYPGIDQPHSMKRGSSIHYYAQDYPGDVVGLIDSQKGLANEYRYTPWGEAESVRETVPNALRFQARELDEGTGMYYFRNRWYDPQLKRFNSEDPIGLEGGSTGIRTRGTARPTTGIPWGWTTGVRAVAR